MAADRYTSCPQCRAIREAAVAAGVKTLEDAYGVVPLDEYKRLEGDVEVARQRAREFDTDRHHTFREDWDIYGARDGAVTIEYAGGCSECGLRVTLTSRTFFPEASGG